MSSIPLLGMLFGGKKSNEQIRPQTPGPSNANPNQPPGRYDSYGHTAGSGSYLSTETDHAAPPQQQSGSGGGVGNLVQKITGAAKWYHMPLITYLMRETAVARVAPLIGRYAMRYPLVEAEEATAKRLAAAASRQQKGVVKAGGLQAVQAREFRHAAPGLRYSSLDQRLAGALVPRFSRVRKFRRAPEVWDDRDAHAIGQRVGSRWRSQQDRFPGQPVLRGGGGRGGGGSHVDSVPRPADVERAVDGHPGSGDRGLDNGGFGARMRRAFGFGVKRGEARIIDDPFEEDSDLISLRPPSQAANIELGAEPVEGNSRGLIGALRA
ncbi:hypothetical protein IWW38_006315, partial [Coemansia aciculifera]